MDRRFENIYELFTRRRKISQFLVFSDYIEGISGQCSENEASNFSSSDLFREANATGNKSYGNP